MSVATFDPELVEIHLTPRARAHVRAKIEAAGGAGMRLGIRESGCSGFMYEVGIVDEPQPSDACFDFEDGVRVFVPREHLALLAGISIDYITEGLNSTLKFDNPNAQSMCGCGESFAVE